MSFHSQAKIYDVYKMFHLDGTFMCYVAEKRAHWYVKRKLAQWVGPQEFKLTFEPQGHGKAHLEYYQQKLDNKCVCCGSPEEEKGLTRHHVVPYVFRSRLPVSYKKSNHYDVLPLCVDCHEGYETSAMVYKNELLKRYDTQIVCKPSPESQHNQKIRMAQEILEKNKNNLLKTKTGDISKLPASRCQELQEWASQPLLEEKEAPQFTVDGWSVIMEQVLKNNTLFEFVKSWRQHFIDNAKPQHLPQNWVVDNPLEIMETERKESSVLKKIKI